MKKQRIISNEVIKSKDTISRKRTIGSENLIASPLIHGNYHFSGKRKKNHSRDRSESKFSRRHWTLKEDNAISELIQKYGMKKWSLIAKRLKEDFGINGRSGKQCRERWQNYLDPAVTKGPITAEEEKKIFMGQRLYGNKWAEIAKIIPGRRDNLIKNHFYSTLRRQLRKTLVKSKIETGKCPNNVNIQCIWTMLKKNLIPYSMIDNENVRELLVHLDKNPKDIFELSECEESLQEKKYNM